MEPIRIHLREVVRFAASVGKIERDAEARKLWHDGYGQLSRDRFGLLGSMTARGEAQTKRLSVLYAVLDMSPVVKIEHLKAALAIWNYCERSAEYVFGNSLGNRTADTLLAALFEPLGRATLSVRALGIEVGRHQLGREQDRRPLAQDRALAG